MPLNPGTEVVHPQWGHGTVVFDKPHCIQIDFVEYGLINFSQEEWLNQKSPPARFRTCTSDLERSLSARVENGSSLESTLLRRFFDHNAPYYNRHDVNSAYERFMAIQALPEAERSLTDEYDCMDFYEAVLHLIEATVKRQCHDYATFVNLEDVVPRSLMHVWQDLAIYDPTRSSFRTWVTTIVLSDIKDAQKTYSRQRDHTCIHDEDVQDHHGYSPRDRLVFAEWVANLERSDRDIVLMLRDGLSQSEISSILGISQPAVSKRITRLRKVIKPPFTVV